MSGLDAMEPVSSVTLINQIVVFSGGALPEIVVPSSCSGMDFHFLSGFGPLSVV